MKKFAALFLLLVLVGCGFKPLYGTKNGNDGVSACELKHVAVSTAPDRATQQLRIELQNQFGNYGEVGRYLLVLSLHETKSDLAISGTDSVTSSKLTLEGTFTLKDSKSNILFTGRSKAVNNYSIVLSTYAALAAESDARNRAIREMARDIFQQISLYFLNHSDTTTCK